MLNLIKYDFRRSRERIWIYYVVLILAQIGISIGAKIYNWDHESMLILNATAYVVGGITLMVQAIRTYNYNLKAYHRRLLPLREVYTVLSPLVMNLIFISGVMALVVIHFGLYAYFIPEIIPVNLGSVAFTGGYQLLWSSCFQFIQLMLVITIARSLRFKGRVWIAIAVLLMMQYVVSVLENGLFGLDSSSFLNSFQLEMNNHNTTEGFTISLDLLSWGVTLFEIGFALILVYVTTMLNKRRVES